MSDENKPVKLSKEQLEKLGQMAADMPGFLEYAHTIGGAPVVPTEQGMIKAQALQAMSEQTGSMMEVLAEFMKLAMKHASAVKDRVEISHEIYGAEIRFVPKIGQTYYLYTTTKGKKQVSLLSPEEWRNPNLTAISKVRLLADHTWQVLERY